MVVGLHRAGPSATLDKNGDIITYISADFKIF
jgi:hypothetical protein